MNTAGLYRYFKKSGGVSIDSRTIKDGDLFFALKGPNFDGHKYISSAFENGASYAIIDDPEYAEIEGALLVSNTEEALQNLARFHRCMIDIPVIGITGSNGKTTTKELLASVLRTKFAVFATKGNLNNHLGVPLSILAIKNHHEIAIIEMGANHLNEIKFLSEIAMPDYGLITNIGKAHLEGFGSIEGVRKGKTELFRYLDSTNGTLFYNLEDGMLQKSIPEHTTNISYSLADASSVSSYPSLEFEYQDIRISSNLSGTYNLINMIAALKVGSHFEIPAEGLKRGIENYLPTNNRSQIKETENNVLILDAYNANPSSMAESINNFVSSPSNKKILILGHMLELGACSKEEHLNLIDLISAFHWEKVFLVGNEFMELNIPHHFERFPSTQELSVRLKTLKLHGNTILLKGSRGIALEKCVEFL